MLMMENSSQPFESAMETRVLTGAFAMGYLLYRLGLPPLVGFLLAGLRLSVFGFSATPLLKTGSDVGV